MTEREMQAHLAAIADARSEADKLRTARQRLFEEMVLKTTTKTIGSAWWLDWAKDWFKRVQDTDAKIKAAGQ